MPEECLKCDCYDSDMGCTCPSIDKWYACPLEPEPTAEDFMIEEELKEYRREPMSHISYNTKGEAYV